MLDPNKLKWFVSIATAALATITSVTAAAAAVAATALSCCTHKHDIVSSIAIWKILTCSFFIAVIQNWKRVQKQKCLQIEWTSSFRFIFIADT